MRTRLVIALLACACLLASCATHVQTAQDNVQGPVDDPTPRVALNATNLECSYAEEWKFNRSGPTDEPPEVGLALSGGGMRAGSYALGVLSALHDLGHLEKVDVISAASGGAYAAGWYLTMKAGENPPTDQQLFAECGARCIYQHHLANHGRLVSRTRTAFALVTDAVMFPVNLLLNGAFGWHENTTGHRPFYERALVSEFFTDPATGKRVRHSFEDLKAVSLERKLPLLIVNTTASIDDDANHYGADLRHTVYELSPVRFGSDAFGYHSSSYPLDLPRAVTVSGAAADLSVLASGNVQKTLLSALNVDLGYYIDNRGRFATSMVDPSTRCVSFTPYPNPKFRAKKWAFRAVPFPFYVFTPYWAKDDRGLRTYLSDGGHSENLGAFSLIRRLVRIIVIVDASGDPEFVFNDYKQLKKAVLQSLNANLEVPDIEKAIATKDTKERRNAISSKPVMTGTVRYFPYPDEPKNERVLNIVYVKLSYDAVSPDLSYKDFPHVIAYATAEKKFPFHGLFDQMYSPQQYRAYRDLAKATVLNAQDMIASRKTETPLSGVE